MSFFVSRQEYIRTREAQKRPVGQTGHTCTLPPGLPGIAEMDHRICHKHQSHPRNPWFFKSFGFVWKRAYPKKCQVDREIMINQWVFEVPHFQTNPLKELSAVKPFQMVDGRDHQLQMHHEHDGETHGIIVASPHMSIQHYIHVRIFFRIYLHLYRHMYYIWYVLHMWYLYHVYREKHTRSWQVCHLPISPKMSLAVPGASPATWEAQRCKDPLDNMCLKWREQIHRNHWKESRITHQKHEAKIHSFVWKYPPIPFQGTMRPPFRRLRAPQRCHPSIEQHRWMRRKSTRLSKAVLSPWPLSGVPTRRWEQSTWYVHVSLYIYMYVYMCIYVYMYVYIYICMCICVYVYVYMCVCINICINVYVYVYIYICVCINVYMCICVCICVHVYVCICIYVCMYVYMYISVYVCMYIYTYYIYVIIYVIICNYTCDYICNYMCNYICNYIWN